MVPTSTPTPDSNSLAIEVLPNRQALGQAAAAAAAARLKALAEQHDSLAVIFATGESQLATLRALTAAPGVPWNRITGFHMDEYLGISEDHPASFRHYLRENLVRHVPFRSFHFIEGSEEVAEKTCAEYAALLQAHRPLLCLLGIGENGHLAFNDPAEADFHDPVDAKVVRLDAVCRRQQVNEGWFASLDEVPSRAITLTIPALMRVPELILSVPGERKAGIVSRTLTEAESTACPATILRRHPRATLYLDADSAAKLAPGPK
ncbi:MAG TPA: glucosamine-6-phosphate deaminase [Terriglobia bacterium]|nr:glucosamine-6-phosphate deaminase [Terriglobia bacterium]